MKLKQLLTLRRRKQPILTEAAITANLACSYVDAMTRVATSAEGAEMIRLANLEAAENPTSYLRRNILALQVELEVGEIRPIRTNPPTKDKP